MHPASTQRRKGHPPPNSERAPRVLPGPYARSTKIPLTNQSILTFRPPSPNPNPSAKVNPLEASLTLTRALGELVLGDLVEVVEVEVDHGLGPIEGVEDVLQGLALHGRRVGVPEAQQQHVAVRVALVR